MANTKEPQVLPPERPIEGASDENLELLASLLDDVFHIPGTKIRFGLDPLIGLIPGLGDAIGGFASFIIVFSAWQRRIPRIAIVRMVANIGIDSLVGAIPFLGDAFDAAWKSNRRNFELLKRHQYPSGRKQLWHDWLFIILIAIIIAAMVVVPILVLWWIIYMIRR